MSHNEILKSAKPILFNTEMVRVIQNDKKTVTRRILKPHNVVKANKLGYKQGNGLWYDDSFDNLDKDTHIKDYSISPCWITTKAYIQKYAPYKPGDILYVRETWAKMCCCDCDCDNDECEYNIERSGLTISCDNGVYVYKATDLVNTKPKWKPSIHMPKEAARIFLRVTDVKVERLQDMTEEDVFMEGFSGVPWCAHSVFENYPDSPIPCEAAVHSECPPDPPCNHSIPELFGSDIWDKTIKKSDLDKYGWNINPWVWVIEFESMEMTK